MASSLTKKPQLRKVLCIGRQKENTRGAALRSHGGGRWRRKSRRWGRPGKASSLWQGTTGPYMPLRRKGHCNDKWIDKQCPQNNLFNALSNNENYNMADHMSPLSRGPRGGNWTCNSCTHNRYISLPKSNSSVNADRTLILIKENNNIMFKSALENLVH